MQIMTRLRRMLGTREAGRIIVYGDIHGCLREWERLRRRLDIQSNDVEISVGDLVNKGPHSAETVRFARTHGVLAVMGNHELKQLALLDRLSESRRSRERPSEDPRRVHALKALSEADIAYLQELPYFLKIDNLTVVHGGITPKTRLRHLSPIHEEELTRLRYIHAKALRPSVKGNKQATFWSALYQGQEGFVVYGHTPAGEVRRDPFALGIDRVGRSRRPGGGR